LAFYGAIYIGSTDNLAERTYQHKTKVFPGFTARYGCDQLVWYEIHESRESAFLRERRLKAWRRSWKLLLIEEDNPRSTAEGCALRSGPRRSPG
jgi:putative endonuclease